MAQAPCFAQWESPGLGRDFAADPARLADDPLWAASGARDVAEYARWAHHVCGMACVRMVLAARGLGAPPILELARAATARGAYVEEEGGAIRGMVYAPCVAWLREAWGVEAEVVVGIDAHAIARTMERAAFFIASVHPSIRAPGRAAAGISCWCSRPGPTRSSSTTPPASTRRRAAARASRPRCSTASSPVAGSPSRGDQRRAIARAASATASAPAAPASASRSAGERPGERCWPSSSSAA